MATDLASLMVKVDSTQAGNAAGDLDKLTAAGKRVEGEMRSTAAAADKMGTSVKGASAAAAEMAREAQQAAASTGAQRAGMQQLGFQMQDFAVQVAGGTSATRAFAMQMPQAIGAVQLMAGTTGRLGSFLGGPWGIAVATATAVLIPLVGKLLETANAAEDANSALADLREQRLAAEQESRLITDGLAKYNENLREQARLEAQIARASGGRKNPDGTPMFAYRQFKELQALRKEEHELFADVQFAANKNLPTMDQYIERTDRTVKARHKLTDAEKAAAKAAREADRAYEQSVDMARSYAEQLQDNIAKFGKSALEIQRTEVAAKAAAAPTAELAAEIRRLGANLELLQVKKATEDFDKMIVALYDEIELSGLVGKEREYRALQLEKEGKMAEWLALGLGDLDKRWLTYAAAKSAAIENNDALEKEKEAIEALREQVDALISSLGNMPGLGGLFGDIGNILTSKNPIASMLGMGGMGMILGSVLDKGNTTKAMGDEFTKSIRATFPGLNEKLASDIGGTLANVFQGSAIGGAVGGVLGGGKNAAMGSQLGGAAGQALGSEFSSAFGKLASAAGPIGAIAGAILGNVLGGLTQATKRGGATIGAGGVVGTWGNSQSRIGQSSQLGGNAVDALNQLASALGVNLGSFSSSVSVRENNLRFDPTGSGISKTSKGAINFGQDEAGLLKAVIADAISDGAFQGLSEGFKNYLTSGDVEKRLQDVLNLKDVMKEASSLRDPQGFALGELDKWREQMVAIATATGEGMADVEYVFAQRRKDILAQFTEDVSEIESQRRTLEIALLAATGKEADALAASRAMELESLPASIRALQESVWAAQDTAQAENELAAARAATASEARSNFETMQRLQAEIFRLQGQEAQAVKIERQLEIDAMQESLRPMLLRKYALQDEASAASEAAAAAAEVAASLAAISRERDGLVRQLMTLAGDKAGLRDMDLAALDPANRELQKAVWAVEDIAAAADATVNANNALISSYNSQINAVDSLAQRHAGLANDIRAFATSLTGGGTAGAGARFDKIAAMARLGDENALSAFTGAAGGYLESARNSAGSYREYQSALIKVLGASGAAAMGADSMSREATAQIAAINESIAQLEVANTIAQSEAENAAKRFLEEFKVLQDLDLVQTDTLDAVNEQTDVLSEKLDQQTAAQNNLIGAINALRVEMQAREEPMVISLGRIETVLRGVEEGGTLRVSGTTDLPVYTSAAP